MNNDLISREALKKALINAHINMALTFDISTFNYVMNTIDNAPTVEAERKSDNLPSCNSCLHNGTWDCIKCKGFDKYERRCGMKEVQTSEHAIAQLPMGTMFEGFELDIEDFMISVYWGGCKDLVKANIKFPKIEGMAQYGDFRHITSEQILKETPDNVSMVTVIYNDWNTVAVLQYGNYAEGGWVMLGRLYGFAYSEILAVYNYLIKIYGSIQKEHPDL